MSKKRNAQRCQCKRTPDTVSKAIGRHVMKEEEQAEVAASTGTERNQGEKVMKPVEFTTCLLIV